MRFKFWYSVLFLNEQNQKNVKLVLPLDLLGGICVLEQFLTHWKEK